MEPAKNHRSGDGRTTLMPHLNIGNQIFHNGLPVQLLYRVHQDRQRDTWRVRPLFVEGPDRNERFQPSDSVSFLHTMRAPRCSRAA